VSTIAENTYVFILRVWLEPCGIEGAAPQFRALVEHVDSGKQRYLKDLDKIAQVIACYIPENDSGSEERD
jgi:hypothetical protein